MTIDHYPTRRSQLDEIGQSWYDALREARLCYSRAEIAWMAQKKQVLWTCPEAKEKKSDENSNGHGGERTSSK